MSVEPPRELVLASAGSGKTYRISSRIIALLARGESPSTVLASTFTRKAAGEILARVLGRLAEAAWDPDRATALGRDTGLPDTDRAFWRAVLARTMRAIHELDVGTLDAFFARAVRAFAHDLGLPGGWAVADEATADRIRARALESVLDSVDQGAMVELVRGIRGGDVRRSVHQSLSQEVDGILEIHRDLADEGPGWDALGEVLRGQGEEPGTGAGGVSGQKEAAEAEREALAEALLALDLPRGKSTGKPLADWENARSAIHTALLGGRWEELVGQTLVQRVLAGEGTVFSRAPVEGAVYRVLRRIADAATGALLAEYHGRARAMGRVGEAYDAALDRALREAGVLRFDDVTRLLAAAGSLHRGEEVGYRMDGRARHLLLDEFQDTSLLQWRAIRPLAEGLLGKGGSEGGTASVVADPKQSIYGWRGAAPVVVEALDGDGYDLVRSSLDTSFRSSRVILDTVNRVFGRIQQIPSLNADPEDAETVRAWARHFHLHAPDERRPAGDFPGWVTLSTGPAREGRRSSQPAFMRHVAERVAALHRGAPDRSVGVLVQRKEALARLILELRDQGITASEEGGTRLVDAPAVVGVLALLRMADHPGNTLARYHVARTAVGPAVGFTDADDADGAARVSLQLRRSLVHRGYGPTLAELRDRLLHRCDARDTLRLGQLVELGHRHDDRPTLRVDDFVRAALKHRVESAGAGAVRVMTVWGAKGLEFDVVVVPELFRGLVGGGWNAAPPLGYRPSPIGGVTHAFPPVNQKVRSVLEPLSPELAAARTQHRAGEVRDALSGLYVAMTRARCALHMIIPAEPKVGSGNTPARLLREALDADPGASTEPGQVLFEDGTEDWLVGAPPVKERAPAGAAGAAARPGPAMIPLKDAPRRRMLPRRRPSDHEPGGSAAEAGEDGVQAEVVPEPGAEERVVELDRLLGLEGWDREGVPATVRGSVVHAWMEAVEWLDEGLPEPGERLRLARREAPDLSDGQLHALVEETVRWLEDRLATFALREALTREGAARALEETHPGARLAVERELPFLRREGDALVEGIIDRLVLVKDGERTLAAHVLDYKTDAVPPDDEVRLRERTELYAPQLRAYRRAVAEAYRIPAGSVRLTLLFLEAGKAVEVEG